MLKNSSFLYVFIINILFIILWHLLSFLACITVKTNVFNPQKKQYQAKDWEKDGRWYQEKLKIKKWKDLLPQYVGKNGFSKEHLTELSLEYLDLFIMETCRAEWNHKISLLIGIPLFLINTCLVAFIFWLLVVLFNLPFIFIQRYNRFRLQSLKSRLLKERERQNSQAVALTNA